MFHRYPRALWALLQDVYAFADAVEKSLTKRETRNELIRQIGIRDGARMSTAATTAAIVVRYVFADQSRQTRSNYSIAMEKATALGVTTDSFAGFLEQYGGVTKVVEHVFDHQADDRANAEATARAIREDKQNRVGLVGRLCTALAHASTPAGFFYWEYRRDRRLRRGVANYLGQSKKARFGKVNHRRYSKKDRCQPTP